MIRYRSDFTVVDTGRTMKTLWPGSESDLLLRAVLSCRAFEGADLSDRGALQAVPALEPKSR